MSGEFSGSESPQINEPAPFAKDVKAPLNPEQEAVFDASWHSGQELGEYKLVDELGRGKYGVVFKATDPTGNEVAIKVPTAKGITVLSAEIGLNKRLEEYNSPFLKGGYRGDGTTVNPIDLEENVPYMVMDLASMGSLKEVLNREGPLSYSKAALLVAQIADALTAMHEQGEGHGDVKPENVLIHTADDTTDEATDEDLKVRLIDFGGAGKFSLGERDLIGTVGYFAPEEFAGIRRPESDAYALGALFYELVKGEPLFPTPITRDEEALKKALKSDIRVIGRKKSESYENYIDAKISDLPSVLRAPLERVLSFDYKNRIADEKDRKLEPTERAAAWDFSYDLNMAILNVQKDIDLLTEIDEKIQADTPLTASELTFLYERDRPIRDFDERDPRIEKLRRQRNIEADLPIVFGCEPTQIAHTSSEIEPDTKAYVGPLEPGIFDKLKAAGVEYVYTSFPEGKIHMQRIEIGRKTKRRLQQELDQAEIEVSPYAEAMLNSHKFTLFRSPQTVDTVRLTVKDLGFFESQTIEEVYKRAEELGLVFCPPQLAPRYCLEFKGNLPESMCVFAMEQIAAKGWIGDGSFLLSHEFNRLGLDAIALNLNSSKFYPDTELIFSLKQQESSFGDRLKRWARIKN